MLFVDTVRAAFLYPLNLERIQHSVHGPQHLRSTASGLYWSLVPGLLPVSAASQSMDHEHGTVCQLNLEHQIRLCAPSSVIWRPTCFSSSLCSAPFLRRRCDCSASSTPTQTYLLTYLSARESKKDTLLLPMPIASANVDRFSIFFHRRTQQWLCNKGIIKDPVIPLISSN